MDEIQVGKVLHYFDKAQVCVIILENDALKIGDTVRFKGEHTDFSQTIESMQVDKKQVDAIDAVQEVAIKVAAQCRRNDVVYKIVA